jgi:hypothetical protein
MMIFIGGLIEWIVDFVTDAWLVRKRRSLNKRADDSWQGAATDVAYLNGLMVVVSAFAVVSFFVLYFSLDLSFGLSMVVSVAPVALYSGYKWFKLLN